MKSMQVVEFGAPLVSTNTELPTPQGTEVLLHMRAAGVCHTDLHLWHGGYDLGHGRMMSLQERGVRLPLTMGHENVGEVVAWGPEVDQLQSGEMRLVYPWLGCGHCDECRSGRENYCLQPDTIGINRPGGYANYLLVPHPRCLIPLQGLDPIAAAPLACSGLTCFSALKKFDTEVLKKRSMVVFGAGGLGLMSLYLHKALGGKGAIVIEPDAGRRAAALEAGAVTAIDPNDSDAKAQVLQAATDHHVLQVLDFVGAEQTAAMAFDLLSKGGHLISVGLFGGAADWPLPLLAIKALTIQGSYVGSLPELKELVQLVVDNELELIPTQQRSLDAVQDALNDLEKGQVTGRVVVTP